MTKQKIPIVAKSAQQEFKRWSYSSWSTYDECGLRFKYRYLDKVPEKPSVAMARGTDIHAKAEHWLLGNLTGPIPQSLQKLEPQMRALRKAKPAIEQWWGIRQDWTPAKYDSWCVAKIDASVIDGDALVVIDHKSGKAYVDKHEKQASLYSALGIVYHPKVKKVIGEMWYLDQGTTLTWEWTREQTLELQALWNARGHEVMEHKDLRPKPGWYCKYCPYSRAEGGQCPVS